MKDANDRTIARAGQVTELAGAPDFPIVGKIAVGKGPISAIAVTPDGSRLLVTNFADDSVSVIDAATCRITGTLAGLGEPSAIAVGGLDSGQAYVRTATAAYDAIAVIDLPAHAVVASHPLAYSVSDLAVSLDGSHVYAGRHGAGIADVALLDTTTGAVETLDLTDATNAVAGGDASAPTTTCLRVSPDGVHLYVASGAQLVAIETGARSGLGGARVLAAVDIGLPIRDVALSPNGARAYVLSSTPEVGAVIDVVDTRTRRITGTRKLGEITGFVTGLTLSGDGDRAYLVSDDSITVLCTLTHDVVGTIGTFGVSDTPSCVVESADATCLYIAEYSGAVTVASVASIVALRNDSAGAECESAEWIVPELVAGAPALV